MPIYLTVDAGGSKCNAILFDEDLNILGRGLTGGVNMTQTSLEDARANIVNCLDQLFSQGCPAQIENVYLSFVGPMDIFMGELKARTDVVAHLPLGEPVAGLIAGGLREEGLLAISGTGSDVFYIKKNAQKDLGRRDVVGAWGPILGDQGSGAWIGQQALRAVVKGIEGWGPQTCLRELIWEAWGLERDWDMVNRVHQSAAPFRQVASVTALVGKAAHMGDAVAQGILRAAGDVMAEQTLCLLGRIELAPEERNMTCCGGAWKAHPLMFEAFCERLAREAPGITVSKPYFEHVMAGPAALLLARGVERDSALNILRAHFPDYIIRW